MTVSTKILSSTTVFNIDNNNNNNKVILTIVAGKERSSWDTILHTVLTVLINVFMHTENLHIMHNIRTIYCSKSNSMLVCYISI